MALFSQSPKPGPYVKEMNDAATFYTNRVLKDYKHRYVPSFTDQIFNCLLNICPQTSRSSLLIPFKG